MVAYEQRRDLSKLATVSSQATAQRVKRPSFWE
jgi:hypothetical protein